MRTLGSPSASTVASDMAVGSRGSPRAASSNQAANSRNGSSAWVKSPDVNQVGCSIGTVSDIARGTHVAGSVTGLLSRQHPYRATLSGRLWRAGGGRIAAISAALAFTLVTGGCSFSYQ